MDYSAVVRSLVPSIVFGVGLAFYFLGLPRVLRHLAQRRREEANLLRRASERGV
jgi:hypothetical protein